MAVARAGAAAALVLAGWGAVRLLGLAGFRLRGAEAGPSTTLRPGPARVAPRGRPARAGATDVAAPGPGVASPAPAPGVASRDPGDRPAAAIGFERAPDGSPMCAPCAVSDEWAAAGLRLSFRSWSADSPSPMVLDAREYIPGGRGRRVLGPALREGRGLEVGLLRLTLPGRPRRVSFSLFGPDVIPRFDVRAGSGAAELGGPAIRHAVVRRYDAPGGGRFREERIVVSWSGGIDRIELDGWGPPGHLLVIDDVRIRP